MKKIFVRVGIGFACRFCMTTSIQNNSSLETSGAWVSGNQISIQQNGNNIFIRGLPQGKNTIQYKDENFHSALTVNARYFPTTGIPGQITVIGEQLSKNDLEFLDLKKDTPVQIKNSKGQVLEEFVAKPPVKEKTAMDKLKEFPVYLKIGPGKGSIHFKGTF